MPPRVPIAYEPGGDYRAKIRWLPVYNASGEVVPPYALMRVAGLALDEGFPVFTVAKPNTDSQTNLLLNGPGPIGVAGRGAGHCVSPGEAAYEAADGTPAAGAEWGAANGSWKLRSGKTGVIVLGTAAPGVAVASFVPGAAGVGEDGVTPSGGGGGGGGTGSGAKVYTATADDGWSVSGAYAILIPEYTNEHVDTDGYWSVGNPTRLTVPSTGLYLAGADVYVTLKSVGTWGLDLIIQLQRNGSFSATIDPRHSTGPRANDPYVYVSTSTLYSLTAGDYIELKVFLGDTVSYSDVEVGLAQLWIARLAG